MKRPQGIRNKPDSPVETDHIFGKCTFCQLYTLHRNIDGITHLITLKSHIRETMNILTDADSITKTEFFLDCLDGFKMIDIQMVHNCLDKLS